MITYFIRKIQMEDVACDKEACGDGENAAGCRVGRTCVNDALSSVEVSMIEFAVYILLTKQRNNNFSKIVVVLLVAVSTWR